MIYFHQHLVETAIKAMEDAQELLDIKNDITIIDRVICALRNYMNYENLHTAQELDEKLREKYSTIKLMLMVADQIPPSSSNSTYAQQQEIPEISHLIQDRYGILCHVLLKKAIISKAEDFIEKVG